MCHIYKSCTTVTFGTNGALYMAPHMNDLKNSIIGQKMCGQCSSKYMLRHNGCMDIE